MTMGAGIGIFNAPESTAKSLLDSIRGIGLSAESRVLNGRLPAEYIDDSCYGGFIVFHDNDESLKWALEASKYVPVVLLVKGVSPVEEDRISNPLLMVVDISNIGKDNLPEEKKVKGHLFRFKRMVESVSCIEAVLPKLRRLKIE